MGLQCSRPTLLNLVRALNYIKIKRGFFRPLNGLVGLVTQLNSKIFKTQLNPLFLDWVRVVLNREETRSRAEKQWSVKWRSPTRNTGRKSRNKEATNERSGCPLWDENDINKRNKEANNEDKHCEMRTMRTKSRETMKNLTNVLHHYNY